MTEDSKREYRQINVHVDKETYDAMRRVAVDECRSISNVIKLAVRDFLRARNATP